MGDSDDHCTVCISSQNGKKDKELMGETFNFSRQKKQAVQLVILGCNFDRDNFYTGFWGEVSDQMLQYRSWSPLVKTVPETK